MTAYSVMFKTGFFHDAVYVRGNAFFVITVLRTIRMAGSAQIDGDNGVRRGQLWHHFAPRPPGLREVR